MTPRFLKSKAPFHSYSKNQIWDFSK